MRLSIDLVRGAVLTLALVSLAGCSEYLVRPARPGDGLRTPADDTVPPNDVDFFLLGKTEVPRKGIGAPDAAQQHIADAEGGQPFTGHMLDMARGGSYAAVR